MKTKLSMILGVLALGFLTSCSNNNDIDTITQQSITGCFSYYSNNVTFEGTAGGTTSYMIELNYTKSTGSITMVGVSIPSGSSYPKLIAKDVPFQVDGALITMSASSVETEVPGFAQSPALADFHMTLLNRVIENQYVPGYAIDFKLGSYTVFSSMSAQCFYGTTTSTDEQGTVFSTDTPAYNLTLASDLKTASLEISGAQFIASMPAMNITLPNIPVKIAGTNVILEASEITPTINNTPFPSFPISNFKATINLASTANISFQCRPGTMPGMYTVVANTALDYKSN